MSDEVKRYTMYPQLKPEALAFLPDVVIDARDFDALLTENLEQARLLGMSAERELALLAERDRLREALEQIENANWSSSGTATDFAISQAKGLLIGKMKRIASAALQGEQP